MISIGGASRAQSNSKAIAMTVIASIARRVRAWPMALGPFDVRWAQQTFGLAYILLSNWLDQEDRTFDGIPHAH